jgi:hypothetical protein
MFIPIFHCFIFSNYFRPRRFATTYISALMIPIVIGISLRSLIYVKHATWYSWGIGALTGCVYTFGFVLMCPQLYINHRLKSVSHLPWNVSKKNIQKLVHIHTSVFIFLFLSFRFLCFFLFFVGSSSFISS